MENQNPSPESTPEPSAIPDAAPAAPESVASAPTGTPAPQPTAETPGDPLLALAVAAKAARLVPVDEECATTLLKERLTAGRAGINDSIEPMVAGLPWIVCVNAISAIWEQLSVPMRRLLLSGIAKHESEAARRLQLSVARAVFKLDPAQGLKLAAAAAASLKNPETGALGSRHRQFFFNVLIGKGKPWLLLLPLKDLKAAEADALVHGAIECFPVCPPFSQLSILRWASEAGRLGKKTNPADLETAAKSVARWNAKLQRQLKAEIVELPPAIAAVLKPEASEPAPATPEPSEKKAEAQPQRQPKPAAEVRPQPEEEPAAVPAPEGETPEAPDAPEAANPPALETPARSGEPRALTRSERHAQREAARQAKKQQKQLPQHPQHPPESHTKEAPKELRLERVPKAPFDFREAMRGVENYVSLLRNELEQTKSQLRRKEDRRAPKETEMMPPSEAEALTRHNARLEATIADLQQQLEDLRAHHEAVAESCLLRTEAPQEEGTAKQLRSLLAIQLSEPYETYLAMRQEALDKVFRLDYRDLLGKVFDTLTEAGVSLKTPAQPKP